MGTDETIVTDSETDSAADTRTDTPTDSSHKPDAVDVDALVEQLRQHADKITPDKIEFLDKKFQPEFTRRLNALNLLKDKTDDQARAALADAGIKVPEDVSIFKDDGKPFLEAILQAVRTEAAPIREQAEITKRNQEIRGYMQVAKEIFPEVREHYDEAIKLVDADPQLLSLAHAYNGKATPLVLRGAAIAVALEKEKAKNAQLTEELRKVKVGTKVGTSSTKTKGAVIHSEPSKAPKLRDVVAQSLASIQAQGETS